MIILRPCVELMHYFYSYWVNEYPVRIITFPYYFEYEGKPFDHQQTLFLKNRRPPVALRK
jgi:hypothetical protein